MLHRQSFSHISFLRVAFSVQTNHLNETSHSILFFHSVWFIHYYEIHFRQFHSFELVLFNAKFSTIKLVSRTNLIYKKQFRIFFWFVNPFQIIFCKFLVGVAGLEPTKESELQRLPPYQLGYTPRFRPLLNYQLLAFLELASVLTLSQWDSNPSLQQACRNLSQ